MNSPAKHLSVLIIDDSDDDVLLVEATLERAGFEIQSHRVWSEDQLPNALEHSRYDCILCDHRMPGFTSLDVIKMVKRLGLDVPFIIVSGAIGEEAAVECMRAGAHDYVMKDSLFRLAPVIEREIREYKLRLARRESERRLAESERRFRTLADVAPILIWEIDSQLRVRYVNQRWKSWLGDEWADLETFPWTSIIHPDDFDKVRRRINRATQERGEFSIEYRLRRADGEWRSVFGNGIPLWGDDGDFQGMIGTVVDMTDLIQSREEAKAASHAKSAFLANMSHEIRTPLGAIVGFASLMKEESDLSEQEKTHYLDIIVRNGQELLRIIGEILDLSKVEAGKIELEIERFRLRDLIDEVDALFRMKLDEKGLLLVKRFGENTPDWVSSDRTKLRQILVNLIGNSAKFASRGSIRLETGKERSGLIYFLIRDTGPGIPQKSQSRLFRPFSQADSSTTREFGGTGLGLALSQRMARALGGDITLLWSEMGRGSCFKVTIADRSPRPSPPVRSVSMSLA